MAGVIIRPKYRKKKRKAVANRNQIKNKFNGIVSLIDISEHDSIAQLLLTKPPIHQPEAGLNPLVDSAAYVFMLMGQLSRTRSHQELSTLHNAIMDEVKQFQNAVYLSNYSPDLLAEYVPLSSYLLCTMLDDVIMSTSWGREGNWKEFSLLHSYQQEVLSRESFLIILERFIQDPKTYIDIMEFTYICLTLGFKYSCHSSGFEPEQLQKILYSLYKRIRTYRGNITRQLSPSPIKQAVIHYPAETWKHRIQEQFSRFFKKSPHSSAFLTTCPDLMEHIIRLENRFQHAMDFLKKRMITKGEKIKLSALPWQMFIGSSDSGKTSLIESSNIKFIASHQSEEQTKKNSMNWQWWVSPESVMIDIGSDYLAVNNTNKSLRHKPWDFLLDLILNERGAHGLNGVTIVMSYSEIMDSVHQHQLLDDLAKRMNDLTSRFGRDLPFNLVITQCDLIPGFLDFFADFTQEELYQAWGAKLLKPTQEKPLTEVINSRFNMLIKRLNNQLITRLNQEKDFNFKSKISILGFPLQMENLKKELSKIIKGLLKRDSHFILNGFYLTSAVQHSEMEETTQLPQVISGDKFLQSLSIMKSPLVSNQSYFVKQLLLYGLISERHKS